MKKETKPTKGGSRPRSGRRPVTDKKMPVTIYIQESKIEKAGGLQVLRDKLVNQFQ